MIPPPSPFAPTDDGNVGRVVSNAQSITYNASHRAPSRLSFDQGSPVDHASVISEHETRDSTGVAPFLFSNDRSFSSCGVTRASTLLLAV